MKVTIEFGGFYDSIHSEVVDQMIDMQGLNEVSGELTWDHIDYKATYNEYAKAWLTVFNAFNDVDLEFEGIDSPNYYNFTTDKIVAYVGDVDEQRLHDITRDPDFFDWADERLTSRDGFISFYDGCDDLIERARNDMDDYAILIGMVCSYLVEVEEINEEVYDLEFDIITND